MPNLIYYAFGNYPIKGLKPPPSSVLRWFPSRVEIANQATSFLFSRPDSLPKTRRRLVY
jgi:hypothetical protein